MTHVTLSDRANAVAELALQIQVLDREMKVKSDELVFMMRKKDAMTSALRVITNDMQKQIGVSKNGN